VISTMNAQLHLALGLIEGRAWTDQDQAILRDVELARETARQRRRGGRHTR
jgi:hypothetical protein